MKISFFGDLWALNNTVIILDKHLTKSDLSIFNLETPIVTSSYKPIKKAGPHLSGSHKAIEQIRKNFSKYFHCSLANNHIMDYGLDGLKNTKDICNKLNISYSGTSKLLNMQQPTFIKTNDITVAIISISEKQFGVSQLKKEGVNYFTPRIYKKINQTKKVSDILILSTHGGQEMNPWPSPARQNLMRSFIDAGASIVYGHHSHIPQGYESYEGGLIMYGLGNFVVDPKRWANTKNALWSNVYSIDFKEGEENGLEAIQCKLIDSNSELKVKKLNKIEKEEYILNCNKPLNNRAFLRALWQEYSVKMYKKVYSNWLNLSFNKKNLKSFAKSLISNKNNKLLLYHLFSCSSHTNAIETALGVLNGEIEDLRTKETKKLVNKYAQT